MKLDVLFFICVSVWAVVFFLSVVNFTLEITSRFERESNIERIEQLEQRVEELEQKE